MNTSKFALCCAMVVLLAGSPVQADRKLKSHLDIPFHLLHHFGGKVKDQNAQQPQPASGPIVAAQPQIMAPQPQIIVQQQTVMVPYVAATPQQPVVAAAPRVMPPPPSVQYVPVPTPVKEYIVKEKVVEKVVVKKVPVFVPVPVKHHSLPLKIAGAVAKSILHKMDGKQVNITVTDEYVSDAPAATTTLVASAPGNTTVVATAPALMATAIPVPTFNATLAGMPTYNATTYGMSG